MTFTKEDLKDSISSQLNISKTQSSALVESFFESIKETLESGENVMISGFGKFSVKEKSERRGKKPVTGEELMLASKKVVRFKCSKKLRERMDAGEDDDSRNVSVDAKVDGLVKSQFLDDFGKSPVYKA